MDFIPVIDIGKFTIEKNPSEKDWQEISLNLNKILSSIGFFYLKNHGIPQTIIKEAFAKSRDFYALSKDTKLKYDKVDGRNYGYVEPNREILEDSGKFSSELRESFDISLPVMHELKQVTVDPVPDCNGFIHSLISLATSCHPLIKILLRILSLALKLEDKEYFIKLFQSFDNPGITSYTTFRSIFYPPIQGEIQPGTTRAQAHTDYGIMTLLFQDDIGGLEVQNANGVWVPATPIPDTILVNTGDLLQYWSGGRFPATTHRVQIPEIEIKKRQFRQSIPYFIHPDDDTMVSPIGPDSESLTNQDPISAYEHTKNRLQKTYKY